MTSERGDILIRYLEGELQPREAEAFEHRLAVDASLRDELERMRRMTGILASSRAESFSPFFVDRALKALQGGATGHAASLYDALQWMFVRTAAASLALVLILSVLNALDYQTLGVTSTWVEAMFGLPSTTIEDAFSYGLI